MGVSWLPFYGHDSKHAPTHTRTRLLIDTDLLRRVETMGVYFGTNRRARRCYRTNNSCFGLLHDKTASIVVRFPIGWSARRRRDRQETTLSSERQTIPSICLRDVRALCNEDGSTEVKVTLAVLRFNATHTTRTVTTATKAWLKFTSAIHIY